MQGCCGFMRQVLLSAFGNPLWMCGVWLAVIVFNDNCAFAKDVEDVMVNHFLSLRFRTVRSPVRADL
jgi:hypothetical protein